MKTLKVLLQEVVSGLKAWASSTFAQDSNTVHKTGDETVGGEKTWTGVQFWSKNAIHVRSVEPGTTPLSDITAGFRMENPNASYAFCDVLGQVNTSGTTYVEIKTSNKIKNGALDSTGSTSSHNLQVGTRSDGSGFIYTDCGWRNSLIPHSIEPNLSLGTSTNKWNNLYATTTNTDTIQSVSGNLVIHSTGTDKGVSIHNGTNAGDGGGLFLYGKTHSNGSLVRLQIYNTTTSSYEAIDLASSSFYPYTNNLINLGTSTKKWKTLNGINPGALSLPSLNYSDTKQWIDISGNVTDETGAENEYDPAVDGWVVIYAKGNPASLLVNVHAPRPSIKKYLSSATGVAAPDGSMIVSVPAPAGSRVYVYFNKGSGSLGSATFITCLGNV